MTPALGRALILLSVAAAIAGAFTAFAAGKTGSRATTLIARRLAYLFAFGMIAANLLMVWALVTGDFSISYVAQVGARDLPLWVKVSSLWSSLEGSILFWGLIIGVYVALAARSLGDRHPEYEPWALAVWLACGAFFAFLIAGPAQPFHTVFPVPPDGPGPNPLLQNHILMVAHPPFLYLGYVGMTIPFGLACAALFAGRLDHEFLAPLRTWLLVAWTFLAVAIVLGGWWAYEVLGWGGYWSWDPVENASFLPWLTATAALHSVIVLERRQVLKAWTLVLVLCSFLLTILGTFMTRSGVFNSVHSFTQSDIGPTILTFFAAALLFSVGLLALRVDTLRSEGRFEAAASREAFFLGNNLLLVLFTFTVLVGTVFPLIVEAVRGVQMSVGRPYFDRMSVPIGVALLFLMGVGPALPWGAASAAQVRSALLPPLTGGFVFALLGALAGVRNPWTLVTLLAGGYAAQVTLAEMLRPVLQRRSRGEALGAALRGAWFGTGARRFGAYVAHAGTVLIFVAIAVSSTMGRQTEVTLRTGDMVEIGRYGLRLLAIDQVSEPHREATVARIEVLIDGAVVGRLEPRMNFYPTQREPIGTPAVRTSVREDLYLSVMNFDTAGGSVGLLAMVNPMVVWIWVASFVMGLGALFALFGTRRRAGESA
ncbi:MAG: heme lyase CcmF/NrfE family subunit [Vicinamibacteria bacterium]|nr:heme lyase CcmF/NrfE family subunit [Vicinamibacteria bacterium]